MTLLCPAPGARQPDEPRGSATSCGPTWAGRPRSPAMAGAPCAPMYADFTGDSDEDSNIGPSSTS
ncbi:hypothetical protein GCM10010508_19200 [Streptomyces naganishii JCM 4654]|uniref:Uncharacterized protein n=1 Tax=Streptomyces naganishii JCM 4654 TaxID=1306179 RepID=A0A919CVY6_9ACTN|nr:hypothetical protein GCM10010508_19200 [Streptomyces naganishii JCM 4654]